MTTKKKEAKGESLSFFKVSFSLPVPLHYDRAPFHVERGKRAERLIDFFSKAIY